MYCIDIKALKKKFDYDVSEDIKEFGKPAFIYNFHHMAKQINALDEEYMWNKEKENFIKKGWSVRKIDKDIEINGKKWKANLWITQPLLSENKVDQIKYKEATEFYQDPLALSIGYMTSGFCYIQLLN